MHTDPAVLQASFMTAAFLCSTRLSVRVPIAVSSCLPSQSLVTQLTDRRLAGIMLSTYMHMAMEHGAQAMLAACRGDM